MASIISSSDTAGLSRPSSSLIDSLLRNSSRGERAIFANSSTKYSRLGGVLRYSITSGLSPDACMMAKVLREVPHFGL